MDSNEGFDMKSCRICLSTKKPLCPLFRYKLSGNYAEMLTAIADVKVASNDGLPDRICQKCCTALEKAYLLKTIAERTDRKLRKMLVKMSQAVPTKKIAFDSFTDIKSEIGPLTVKAEPKWELEVDLNSSVKPVESIEGKDIVIANTVIRKVDGTEEQKEESKSDICSDKVDLTWSSNKSKTQSSDYDTEYLDDDLFQDDGNDSDYEPLSEKQQRSAKFKKPKLSDIKVFKGKKTVVRKVKILSQIKTEKEGREKSEGRTKSTTITCYPIMKNGSRGPPILLKRPKDATILKVHPNYKKPGPSGDGKPKDKSVRVVRTAKPVVKQREKLVCPICGILTYTLGNHIATHQEKKKFNCSQCSRTFSQKGNLMAHMKQHTGIKDFICDICGAGFYSQKSLVRHNLIHKGERPFACNLCTKKFIARCDLNRHLRIHSGYKPFKCGTCTMSFNAKHQLQNHERMHTGERPYTCQVCNVAFSYKVNLNNHVFKVHGINLKFKSIHIVTEDILRREMGMANETRMAIMQIAPQMSEVPPPAAHETVHHTSEYN
ncbi:zinc finger protein 879-like isoform X1 [Hyposmocoma kahamanoa]|uniref:zinc finger protein 879-like isoform X1 n=1 Tax=Hyposmocoma kahamanoa TaxID=1477025 RepID=UPI000E6D95CB|nr:zinc finger protein 879-like isoform X1 [Hyposmocoma kahamanoa]